MACRTRSTGVISRALAKQPEERYPNSGALVAAAESALGLRRPAHFRTVALAVAAIVVAIAATVAVAIAVSGGRGPSATPRTHKNTLVRIDPHRNAVQGVINVGAKPMAVAAWGRTVWVYSQAAGVVSEVDAQTNRVLHATRVLVSPVELRPASGPVLAADSSGAWIVGHDHRGRGVLTQVLPGGGRRPYPLGGRPVAVATGLHAIWVLDDGSRDDRLLRLDPATGTVGVQHRFPVSSRVATLTFGFKDVWVVSSKTATLYRVDPRSNSVRHLDLLAQRAGRPSALDGNIWVGVSSYGSGQFDLVNPQTLQTAGWLEGGVRAGVGTDSADAFGSVWGYDVADGEVHAWHPPNLHKVVSVTDAPTSDGSCITSLAAGGGAVWVTLAPSINFTCHFF